MARVFVGIGSNLGDPEGNIREALARLEGKSGIKIIAVSSLYLTEPVGLEDQPWFHNCVAELETELDPYELLEVLQDIENNLGRVRTIRWGPRTVDLDILLYDDMVSTDEKLIIPHPRMKERAFVMIPLAEIAPEMRFPDQITVAEIRKNLVSDKKCNCIHKKIW